MGHPAKSWSNAQTRWGSIEPISGREFFNSEKVQANATHRVRMRYDSAQEITPKDRLLWDSRVFNIVHVAKKREIDHELEIMVEEVVE